MRVIIVEDESFSADKLETMLKQLRTDIDVVGKLPSVNATIEWFTKHDEVDLVFMDIHLSDGVSFQVFEKVEIKAPIIFTTAFDQYAIQAFKHNSIDYLLKPIDVDDLERALLKYESLGTSQLNRIQVEDLKDDVLKRVKKRFLVKLGSKLESVPVTSIAYFKSANKLNYLVTHAGQQYVIDYTMDQVFEMVDETQFFKINRGMIVHIDAIDQIHSYFNGRLKLDIVPQESEDVLVSRDRVADFKAWLDH